MASVQIIADSASTLRYASSTACYVRSVWGASWEWMPYLYPLRCTDAVSPNVPSAYLDYNYGQIKRADSPSYGFYNPTTILGKYVSIWAYNPWGSTPLWAGIIDSETVDPHGTSSYAQGVQHLTAYGLEHLLDRVPIVGTYTAGGYIDREVVFNRRNRYGSGWTGNRSTDPVIDDVYAVSADGATWTNLQLLKYVLASYSPFTITLCGETEVLESVVAEHDLRGDTIKTALDKLVDRHRGLGWKLVIGLDDTISLYIFSVMAEPVAWLGTVLPANTDQTAVNLSSTPWLDPHITTDGLNQYDRIVAEGQQIGVCFSLSNADGTLIPAWTADAETAYEAGSSKESATTEDHDTFRNADTYKDVYQKYSVPADWDYLAGDGIGGTQYTTCPGCTRNGETDPTVTTYPWQSDVGFERFIPIYVGTDGEEEPRRPFVLVADTDGNYHYIDKLKAIEEENGSLSLADNELAMWVSAGNMNHVYALNHWAVGAAATNKQPVFDYESFIATVFMKCDTRLTVTVDITDTPWSTDLLRTKRIRDDDAALWVVLPGTVTDVADGALVHVGVNGSTVRTDVARLRAMAVFAAAYYGQQRRAMTMTVKEIIGAHAAGSLMVAVLTGGYWVQLGTVVTERTWDFDAQTTTIRTGFQELI